MPALTALHAVNLVQVSMRQLLACGSASVLSPFSVMHCARTDPASFSYRGGSKSEVSLETASPGGAGQRTTKLVNELPGDQSIGGLASQTRHSELVRSADTQSAHHTLGTRILPHHSPLGSSSYPIA